MSAPNDAWRNPVVFIPGIMGSKLVDTESAQSVWGDFSCTYADPGEGANRRLIALPMARNVTLDRLASRSEADGAMREARPRRLPVSVAAYRDVLDSVGIGAAHADPQAAQRGHAAFGSFEFGYDWRRSLDESARRLDDFLRLAGFFVRAMRGSSAPVKFDVVAHSMGGLVLRYYLAYGTQLLPCDGSLPRVTWAGAERIARAVLIGTPSAGSAMAIQRLVSGLTARPLVHPGYDPFIVGTMPALYQLLPRTRHHALVTADGRDDIDLYDPGFWESMGWGLAGADGDRYLALQLEGVPSPAERRSIALDHLAKCLLNARTFHAAIDRTGAPPAGLELHLVAGNAHRTPAVVAGARASTVLRTVRDAPGDAVVPVASALTEEPDGRDASAPPHTLVSWNSVRFATARHMQLAQDRAVIDHVLHDVLAPHAAGAGRAPRHAA